MRRCVCLHAIGFFVGFLLVPDVVASPSYFWFRTFGVSDYAARYTGPDLNVAHMHDTVGAAVSRHEEDMECLSLRNYGYNDDIYNYDLHGVYAPVNNYDFAVVHTHGNPPDCGENDWAPFYLGYCEDDCSAQQSQLEFGGNGYLKWLWAASCQMFYLPVWRDRIYIFGTTRVMNSADGTAEFVGLGSWTKLDEDDMYAASGIAVVDSTTLTGCGSDDWYTRYSCLKGSTRGDLNKMLLKVSAPGFPWVRRGTVEVYTRNADANPPEDTLARIPMLEY